MGGEHSHTLMTIVGICIMYFLHFAGFCGHCPFKDTEENSNSCTQAIQDSKNQAVLHQKDKILTTNLP